MYVFQAFDAAIEQTPPETTSGVFLNADGCPTLTVVSNPSDTFPESGKPSMVTRIKLWGENAAKWDAELAQTTFYLTHHSNDSFLVALARFVEFVLPLEI